MHGGHLAPRAASTEPAIEIAGEGRPTGGDYRLADGTLQRSRRSRSPERQCADGFARDEHAGASTEPAIEIAGEDLIDGAPLGQLHRFNGAGDRDRRRVRWADLDSSIKIIASTEPAIEIAGEIIATFHLREGALYASTEPAIEIAGELAEYIALHGTAVASTEPAIEIAGED